MNINRQIVYNGTYIPENEKDFSFSNRAFLYGDSIFETFRVENRTVLFFEEHLERLVEGMQILKYNIPEKFTILSNLLKEEINGLLNRNKVFKSSRVRITVYRNAGGLYTPETNDIDYIITFLKLNTKAFSLNSDGLQIAIFPEIKKPINLFSPFKTGNSLIYTLAGVYKKEIGVDDCLILNEKNKITEAVSSNVFIVKNKTLITPPLYDGCIKGIMRKKIIELAKTSKITVIEQSISEEDLFQSEEIFLTNSISGIQWVVAYKNKRFYKRMSDFLMKKLNETLV